MRTLPRRTFSIGCTLLLALALVYGIKAVSGLAQSPPQENRPEWKVKKMPASRRLDKIAPETGRLAERVIEEQIPTHIPIRVEILNMKDPMLRNISVKVTNTGSKPVYYLDLDLTLPDVLLDGIPSGFTLRYGRPELIRFSEPLQSGDVPILPGESTILRPVENNVTAFEKFVDAGKLSRRDFDRIILWFVQINFGDRTGFSGSTGVTIPNPRS